MMPGTLKRIRSAWLRSCVVVLNICRDKYDLHLYFWYMWGNKFPVFLAPKGSPLDNELLPLAKPEGQAIGNSTRVCKNVHMRLIVGQVLSSAKMIAWSLANFADNGVLSVISTAECKGHRLPFLMTQLVQGAPHVVIEYKRGNLAKMVLLMVKARHTCLSFFFIFGNSLKHVEGTLFNFSEIPRDNCNLGPIGFTNWCTAADINLECML